MRELVVTPPAPPGVSAAIRSALERGGVSVDERPLAYTSAWRRAAAREAIDNEPSLRRSGRERYTLSPRSTRGATRA